VDGDKTYAELGIPGRAPCPPWCTGSHPDSITGPRREAVIFHRASAIGGGVLVNGEVVTLGMNWAERFEGGTWQPFRGDDVVVFFQAGTDYIPVDATERNLAGLAAIARLISPDVEDRLRQVQRLLWETRDARQAIPR
jgi:hypothetical protein